MFAPIFVSYSPTIFVADFTGQTVGVATIPSGLSFSRASSGYTVQSSATTLISGGFAVDVARIGSDGTHKGLVLEEARTNNAQYAVLVGNPVSATGTPTVSDITGPDGATTGRQIQDTNASGFQFQFFNPNNFSNGTAVIASCWGKLVAGTQGTAQVNGDSADLVFTSASWAKVANPGTSNAVSPFSINFVPTNLVASSLGTCAFYGMQYEAGKFASELILTTGAAATRAGERLWFTTAPVSGGKVSLELQLQPRGASNAYGSAMRILTIDANNYVEISQSTLQVTCVVGGASQTLSTAMSWAAGDTIDVFAEIGNGAPKVQYRKNAGSTIVLGTGTTQAAIAAGGTCDVACNGTSNQWSAWIRKVAAYQTGAKPTWAS